MKLNQNPKTQAIILIFAILLNSCTRQSSQNKVKIITQKHEDAVRLSKEIKEKTAIKLADGLQIKLWASDSLSEDPVSMSMDDQGRVYINSTNRNKHSEFDIRGHRDWMTESIAMQSVEERRAFIRKTFAPENSLKNAYLKDLNEDGSHDFKDLQVEKEEIWRIEDSNNDGVADKTTVVISDFNDEISDVAGGVLIRKKDAFVAVAPDMWRFEDKNGDGIYDKKTSISTGYGVHIGFGGHNMSNPIEGPDGRIYWNMGDIGGNITALGGSKHPNPNSGFIARSNPDGSDFEIFATGLRNTHEFVFDEYGNLISSDNDGDHPGESERLVHIVRGSDAGWRSNWQYGKYTDARNNKYNVWMNEKLFKPRWEGQAAYIIPPIMNFHNGPTGMIYNPGTGLGQAWKNKFFLVEFVGMAARSPIWAFDLKPKGASFELKSEQNIVSGILPTGIRFGPEGAIYIADWITGWDAKNNGRVWKLDVNKEKNDLEAIRKVTQALMTLDYEKANPEKLQSLLGYEDMRIRQKAQFELANRGEIGFEVFKKTLTQKENQLARIHAIWGIGQLARKDNKFGQILAQFSNDSDEEIIVQVAKIIGDSKLQIADNELIGLLKSKNQRIQFYAAEALGINKVESAVQPLIDLLKTNNDDDVYIRHAAVLALSKIAKSEPIVALQNNESKALRTAAVLVLRKLKNENIALFLNDTDEYIATEAARGIHDDLSIEAALPKLAEILNQNKFTNEALIRRAISAALRVGTEKELDLLINFAVNSTDEVLKTEVIAAISTFTNPSVLDRVDGRFRGKFERDGNLVKSKIKPFLNDFLNTKNPEILLALTQLVSELNLTETNAQLALIYKETTNSKIKTAILPALNKLQNPDIKEFIKSGMEDKDEIVRTVAIGLLNNNNVSKETLPALVNGIFNNGSTKEKQQLLIVLGKMEADKTKVILSDFINQLIEKKFATNLTLELKEAVEGSGDADLKNKLAGIKINSPLDEFAETLFGGNKQEGRNTFNYNSTTQCVRCHTASGPQDGGAVGPPLSKIASVLSREQLLESLIDPSARLSPGYGSVYLKFTDGQEVNGILAKETSEILTITTSDAEPLIIPIARIAKRENMPSSMPPMGSLMTKREIRDMVEYLSSLK